MNDKVTGYYTVMGVNIIPRKWGDDSTDLIFEGKKLEDQCTTMICFVTCKGCQIRRDRSCVGIITIKNNKWLEEKDCFVRDNITACSYSG